MNATTLKKVHQLGEAGKVVLTILLVVNILAAAAAGLAAAALGGVSRETISVSVTSQATYQGRGQFMQSMWQTLTGSWAAEKQQDQAAVTLPGSLYTSADMRREGEQVVIETVSTPNTYTCADAARLLVFAALASAASVAALWLLRKLFKTLEGCESVFCEELVKRMKAFGWSLLPLAVLASVAETVARRFMAAGVTAVYIQWGLLIAFAVTMCLAVVFRYGVKLQRESDETL